MQINFDFESYRSMFSGGARTYLFFVPLNFPGISGGDNSLSTFGLDKNSKMFPYLVKTTNLPDITYEEISGQYSSYNYKIAGTKTYADWQITFNIDDKGLILDKFHTWLEMVNSTNSYSPKEYMKHQDFYLLDNSGNAIKTYKLYYCWPKSVGEIQFDYSQGEIATVTVTFSYMYYESSDTATTSSAVTGFIKTAFNLLGGNI